MVFQRQELMIFDNSHNTNLQIQHAVITNKHCEILVSCSDKERNCMQALETACKLIELQLQGTACKLRELHAS